ncbi:MAG TPA: glycosyltransferase, partial [Mycobacteriales bacterium]|nr:glycosyltransferase [Mycobacteriales bacterium]
MRVTHVVVTDAFAGTERYVADVARRTAERGHEVLVLGGAPTRMPAAVAPAAWLPAPDVRAAVRQLMAAARPNVVHTHLTAAE